MPKPIEVPRHVRRELDAIRKARITGRVMLGGHEKYAWFGSLVTKEAYEALMEAGAHE